MADGVLEGRFEGVVEEAWLLASGAGGDIVVGFGGTLVEFGGGWWFSGVCVVGDRGCRFFFQLVG